MDEVESLPFSWIDSFILAWQRNSSATEKPTQSLVRLAELVLTLNTSHFDGNGFLARQTSRVEMIKWKHDLNLLYEYFVMGHLSSRNISLKNTQKKNKKDPTLLFLVPLGWGREFATFMCRQLHSSLQSTWAIFEEQPSFHVSDGVTLHSFRRIHSPCDSKSRIKDLKLLKIVPSTTTTVSSVYISLWTSLVQYSCSC